MDRLHRPGRQPLPTIAAIVLGLPLAACELTPGDVQSSFDVANADFAIDAQVSLHPDGSHRVSAIFEDMSFGGRRIEMTHEDAIYSVVGPVFTERMQDDLFGNLDRLADGTALLANIYNNSYQLPVYEASLYEDFGASEAHLLFRRESTASTYGTRVELPAPFTLDSPLPGEVYTAADSIVIGWTTATAADRVEVRLVGSCLSGGTVVVDPGTDDGSHTLDAAGIATTSLPCDFNLVLYRINDGVIDPAMYQGGSFTARRWHEVSLTLGN